MTPLAVRLLRWKLWLAFWRESVDFCVTIKYVRPKGTPPYDWKPYYAFVNRVGRGPWWRIWRPWRESRTIGPMQMFEGVDEVLKVARLQAFEILHPEEAAEIAARDRPVIPPPPPPSDHEYQIRLVTDGAVGSCKCGWDGKHVGDISGNDTECRFEFDQHMNEVTAKAREGTMREANANMLRECRTCEGYGNWTNTLGPAFEETTCEQCGRLFAMPHKTAQETA